MRRTGAAAMVTVFAAQSEFERLAARVNALHGRIAGETPGGQRYRADDPDLLRWVQVTASFAFLSAYTRYVRPLSSEQVDQFYEEAAVAAGLYGVLDPPRSDAELRRIFNSVAPRLTPSPIIGEFLRLVRGAPILPSALQSIQHLIARAAITVIPHCLRRGIGLAEERRSSTAEERILRLMARTADHLDIQSTPWALASQRLGLPTDYLLRCKA
jgi:uncharacterized protein (DUF2236 family)